MAGVGSGTGVRHSVLDNVAIDKLIDRLLIILGCDRAMSRKRVGRLTWSRRRRLPCKLLPESVSRPLQLFRADDLSVKYAFGLFAFCQTLIHLPQQMQNLSFWDILFKPPQAQPFLILGLAKKMLDPGYIYIYKIYTCKSIFTFHRICIFEP